MLKRFVVIMAVLTTCLSGAYAQTAKDTKGSVTVKKPVVADTVVKKEPLPQPKEIAASDALKHALATDKDRKVRRNAAKSLGDIKDARSVKVLVRHLNDADPHVRKAAYAALKKIGTPAVPPLTAAMSHRNPIVRRQAAALIGEVSRAAPSVAKVQKKEEIDSALHANASGAIASANKRQPSGLD